MPTTARTSRRRAPATSSRSPGSRARPPATRSAIPTTPVVLERMEFPEPVIEIAVEPKTKGDQEKMGQALARLATGGSRRSASPSIHESGQTVIKGMGELHLEIIVDRMKREFKVEANVGAPQVAYRETITRTAEQSTTPTRSRPAAPASSRGSRSASSRCRRARASCSRTTWSAASVPQGIRARRREGPEGRRRRPACSPASR